MAEKHRICMEDEKSMDLLSAFIEGAIPGIIKDTRHLSITAGRLPPRGFRGYSTTGAAGVAYCAGQHVECATDPDWTMGMCFDSGAAGYGAYNFALSCADGGRGLIAENKTGTVAMWQGKVTMHGTTVDKTTFPIDEGLMDPPIGIALYLKSRALKMGERLAQEPLSTFRMVRGNGSPDQEYCAGAPGWLFV